MRVPARSFIAAAVACLAIFAAAAVAWAETGTLELKRVDRRNPQSSNKACGMAAPQRIFVQTDKNGAPMGNTGPAATFKRIVTKEPKYESKNPFRAVVKLGSQEYAFALDAIPPAEEAKQEGESNAKKPPPTATGFNRLYIDLNRNGDLSDDKPIDAELQKGPRSPMASFQFPRVDIVLDEAGVKLDYSFSIEGRVFASATFGYTLVEVSPAAYREGDITLDGKKHHVVLLDFNSDGRFDSKFGFGKGTTAGSGGVPAECGDMLLIDPKPNGEAQSDVNLSECMYYVSKLIDIDGRLYDVKISPAGDKLTLNASTLSLGKVRNPSGKFSAMIYGDLGVLQIRGDKDAAIPVPEGEWKLFTYTLDLTGVKPPKNAEEKKAEKKDGEKKKGEKNSMLDSMAGALQSVLGDGSSSDPAVRPSTVDARAPASYKAVKVVKGKTVLLPFGPPYKPVVTAQGFRGGANREVLSLDLTLVGSAGEICDDMTVKGSKPSKPRVTITDAKGKVVDQGRFEYG
jgi:hypothetical protein